MRGAWGWGEGEGVGCASAGRKVFSKECWCSTLGVPNYPLFICHSGEMVQNDVGGWLFHGNESGRRGQVSPQPERDLRWPSLLIAQCLSRSLHKARIFQRPSRGKVRKKASGGGDLGRARSLPACLPAWTLRNTSSLKE